MGWRHPCGMTIFYVGGRIPYPPPRFRRASGSRISLMLVVPEFSAPTSGSSFFQLYQKRNLRSNQAVLPGPFCGSRQKKAGYFSSTAAPASSSLALAASASSGTIAASATADSASSSHRSAAPMSARSSPASAVTLRPSPLQHRT